MSHYPTLSFHTQINLILVGETLVDECHMPISDTESDGSEEDALGWNPSSSEDDTDDDYDTDCSYMSEDSDDSVEGAEDTI